MYPTLSIDTPKNPLRLELLKLILFEWVQGIGPKTLRERDSQNLIDPSEELGEEACSTVFSQLAILLACCGVKVPALAIFRVTGQHFVN